MRSRNWPALCRLPTEWTKVAVEVTGPRRPVRVVYHTPGAVRSEVATDKDFGINQTGVRTGV